MAAAWIKSLDCKSRAFHDVYNPNPKFFIPNSSSCGKSAQTIKDVIETAKHKSRRSKPSPPSTPSQQPKKSGNRRLRPGKVESGHDPVTRARLSNSARPIRIPDSLLPALMELPQGHPSRNVVEIIFHTSWGPKAFTGRIEMIFKVQNGSKTVTRFEEYREMVKKHSGAGGGFGNWEENVRCAVDGNELMQFHSLGPTASGGGYDSRGGALGFHGGKGAAICTFSGSGGAHENAGGGRGRRAMLVCRVIAGRVAKRVGIDSVLEGRVGFDSVSGDNDELVIFDSRAVLRCFLIIYKL